ncbi:MAG: hypothetical protein M3R15_08095 [Acidobacteriota bacterium]|nr:hypothetical protein [Acidobacteriota bacterium]
MQKKKKRIISQSFKIAELSKPANQIDIDLRTGELQFLADGQPVTMRAENVVTTVHFDRKTKQKVLNVTPQPSASTRMSLFSFLEEFDVLFAIDTNTRTINTDRHSVAAMSVLEIQNLTKTDGVLRKAKLNINMFGALIRGKNMPGNPENWMWKVAIEDGIKKLYPKYSDSLRIGLIVDSNLAVLPEYNARTEPIFESYFLPPNFTLVYATADGGAEYILNRLIRLCDKEADKQLKAIAEGKAANEIFTKLDQHEQINYPFTAFPL